MNDQMTRITTELAPHARVKHLVGRWRQDSDEALALRRSIKEQGILVPLIITADGYILDGVTRWQAAKALQLETVPCTVRPESEALDIMIHSELHRRHQTKSQLAFRLAPLIEEAWRLAKEREINGYKLAGVGPAKSFRRSDDQDFTQNSPSGTTLLTGKTVGEYAEQMGVSVRLLEQAHELHQIFAAHPEEYEWQPEGLREIGCEPGETLSFRDYFTEHIIECDMSLGGALAGIKARIEQAKWESKGKPHTGGRPKRGQKSLTGSEKSRQLELIQEAWTNVGKRWTYWDELAEDERAEVGASVAQAIHAAPDDVLAAMRRAVDIEWKHRKENQE